MKRTVFIRGVLSGTSHLLLRYLHARLLVQKYCNVITSSIIMVQKNCLLFGSMAKDCKFLVGPAYPSFEECSEEITTQVTTSTSTTFLPSMIYIYTYHDLLPLQTVVSFSLFLIRGFQPLTFVPKRDVIYFSVT